MDQESIGRTIEVGGGALLLLLSVAAVISVLRSRVHRRRAKVIWVLFALIVPLAGPVLWFLIGRATPMSAGVTPDVAGGSGDH